MKAPIGVHCHINLSQVLSLPECYEGNNAFGCHTSKLYFKDVVKSECQFLFNDFKVLFLLLSLVNERVICLSIPNSVTCWLRFT